MDNQLRLTADDEGRYVEVNEEAVRVLGYSRDELLSMSVWDLTPPVKELDGLVLWQDFIRAGEQSGRYALKTKRGLLVWFDYRAQANITPGRHESVLSPVHA
ncbi:MAG TPA: PAS domain S-box protein [Candidatus Dormibacteraeota bacterium]|jgi:PAS domain S-box-containing protein